MKFKSITLNKEAKISEGVLYNKNNNSFIFDFENNSKQDIIVFNKTDISAVKYKDHVYLYGYQLRKDSPGSSKFISWLKDQFNNNQDTDQIRDFINAAINWLNRDINIKNFKCIIYPDTTKNKLVKYIISGLTSLEPNDGISTEYCITKNIPSEIYFDWDVFKRNNPDYYTIENKNKLNELTIKINSLLNAIHNKEYFKLHECGLAVNQRIYLRNFLKVNNDNSEVLKNLLNTDKVLLVDDTLTSGATIDEMTRAISVINPNCDIYIFTLVRGRDGSPDNFSIFNR